MRTSSSLLIFALILFAGAVIASTKTPKQAASNSSSANPSQVKRGKYLVEEVARCTECHTPRDSQGNLDNSRALQGAPVWIVPVHPDHNWAQQAPPLAGFAAYTDSDGVAILEKGRGPNGETIRPPMHIYHLNHEDAVAIIAYLKSVPPSTR
ncbi:MAG: c-type cytochrome [Candidatus Acidiferrales bacterium]|jgi:cytochrome c